MCFFKYGGRGWHPKNNFVDGNINLILQKCNKYMLQERENSNYDIMKGYRLMQQYLVISYEIDQAKNLQYHSHKVNNKR